MFGGKVPTKTVGMATILSLIACGGSGEAESSSRQSQAEAGTQTAAAYTELSVEELRTMMSRDDPFLVNVHVPFEGNLPETDASIPFDQIADHLDQLPQDKNANIILYCRSGRMSAEAGAVLADLGYTNVSNLEGGFRAWEAAGYEIVR